MLKLLLVDDEEIICNTIARVIPWDELGITLIGTCLDGVDAYQPEYSVYYSIRVW